MNTERKAAKLWCPMVRVATAVLGGDFDTPGSGGSCNAHKGSNYTVRNPVYSRCIASSCAMWRWDPVTGDENGERRWKTAENEDATTEKDAGPKPPRCEGWEFCGAEVASAGWIEPEESARARRTGYCGLAGSPMVCI